MRLSGRHHKPFDEKELRELEYDEKAGPLRQRFIHELRFLYNKVRQLKKVLTTVNQQRDDLLTVLRWGLECPDPNGDPWGEYLKRQLAHVPPEVRAAYERQKGIINEETE